MPRYDTNGFAAWLLLLAAVPHLALRDVAAVFGVTAPEFPGCFFRSRPSRAFAPPRARVDGVDSPGLFFR
jgi:hypothetical protein